MAEKEKTVAGRFQGSLRRMLIWFRNTYDFKLDKAIEFVEKQYCGTIFTWGQKLFARDEIKELMEKRDFTMIYPWYEGLVRGDYDADMPDLWNTLDVRARLPPPSKEREREILDLFEKNPPMLFWDYVSLFHDLAVPTLLPPPEKQ